MKRPPRLQWPLARGQPGSSTRVGRVLCYALVKVRNDATTVVVGASRSADLRCNSFSDPYNIRAVKNTRAHSAIEHRLARPARYSALNVTLCGNVRAWLLDRTLRATSLRWRARSPSLPEHLEALVLESPLSWPSVEPGYVPALTAVLCPHQQRTTHANPPPGSCHVYLVR